MIGRSRLLHTDRPAPEIVLPAGPRPLLAISTYLANAGLSERDAAEVEALILGRVRRRIAEKARIDDAGQRFRYLNDVEYRSRVNRELIGEAVLELGFTADELRVIDEGLKLGLVAEDPKPTVARVLGADGREVDFEIDELEDLGPEGQKRVRLTDARTGEVQVV